MNKDWYKSKTLWTGLSGVIAGAGTYFQTGDLTALGTSAMGLLMIALRLVTKQPIG